MPSASGRQSPRPALGLDTAAAAAAHLLTATPLLLASLGLGAGWTIAAARAMDSPWWENYDQKDRYLCAGQGGLVVERNEAQASLISGRGRMILFREASEAPGLRYRNEDFRIILRGDELTLERLPMRLTCVRTDQV